MRIPQEEDRDGSGERKGCNEADKRLAKRASVACTCLRGRLVVENRLCMAHDD